MKFTKHAHMFLAGADWGLGLAFFLVFLIASNDVFSIPASYKNTFGLLGVALWGIGLAWGLSIRKRQPE